VPEDPIPDIQQFEIRYAGGSADQDSIPLDDLIESLRGFEDFFRLTDSIYVRGSLTRQPLPPQQRIDIRVRRIAPGGSMVAVLEFVGLALAAGMVGNAGWDFVKGLWRWREAVIRSRTQPARFGRSMEENVAALESMAREAGIKPSDHDEDPAEIVQEFSTALQDALAPIAHSVETIAVASEDANVNLILGRTEKLAVFSEVGIGYQAVENSEWEEVEVGFVRIHTGTGQGLVKFKKPRAEDEKGIRPCSIVDPRFRRANDPFTQALSRRGHLKAWARKAIFNPETGAFRWELRLTPPVADRELFSDVENPRGHRMQANSQPKSPAESKRKSRKKK
jgi:hypothetical protein